MGRDEDGLVGGQPRKELVLSRPALDTMVSGQVGSVLFELLDTEELSVQDAGDRFATRRVRYGYVRWSSESYGPPPSTVSDLHAGGVR
jgi:hypothetical protein